MRTHRRVLTPLAAVFASVALLAGCASSPAVEPAEADATSTPTPVADESSVVALTIAGSAITSVDDNGDVVSTLDYTSDGQAAVTFLSDAFGSEPVVSPRTGDGSCVADATQATWGADAFVLVYDFPERTGHPDAQSVAVEAKSGSVGDVAVLTPQGVAVGAQVAELEAAIPNVGTHLHGGDPSLIYVDYDVASGTYEDMTDSDFGMTDNAYWGAQAVAKDDVITEFAAPVYFQSAC